ncbi:probable sulfate transporter 4.2 isoform X2 [Nymphaea colorata]|uniref:probable sulfate transporter 4.2 isoform X2 n=1 Tax=Nymphaea colorata TaxID=210225 RepID=UPI00129DB0E9|nr:probable sulfate transporter 4.2 isoform X2 [Nymphaea colorata]
MEISYASSSAKDFAAGGSGSGGGGRQVKVIPLRHPDPSSASSSLLSSLVSLLAFLLPPRWRTKFKQMTLLQWMEVLIPCIRWIRTYKWREYLQVDLMAGLTVGIMLVPQAMSYAKLAGLQPIYGLYSGFVPIFIYAIFGSSRQLAIGPVALVSLLVSNVLAGIADTSSELYTELAILLALMVGVLECIMGFLRLGWIIRFISHSVISVLVAPLCDGIYHSRSSPCDEALGKNQEKVAVSKGSRPAYCSCLWYSFCESVSSIINFRAYMQVGEIPQGLPKFSVPKEFGYLKSLIPTAFLITGVAILESVGIAKALAAKNGYELDSNQELFGLGVANVCGSFFSIYPTTGSFSRSAVNHESGAKTGLSGIVMGIIMGCALLFMTPLFTDIPQCCLAAIVISAVMGLVDYDEAIFLWHTDKKDFLLWTITCITTLFFGIEIGVLVGVGSSLAFVIHESANPHIAVLGRLPGTTVYRNVQQYPEAYTYHGIVIVRVDAPIYFANISYIKERLQEYEIDDEGTMKRGPEVEKIYFVIIEMAPVTYIDSSAIQALKDLYQEYQTRGIQLALSNPNQKVLQTLASCGVLELIGKEWYFVRVHDAVQVCLQHVQNLKESPKKVDPAMKNEPSIFQRSWKQNDDLKEPLIV